MEREYWAMIYLRRGSKAFTQCGPYASRELALSALRQALLAMPRKPKGDILTGYGLGGPWFDLQWHTKA
jgi:hypothetical protein